MSTFLGLVTSATNSALSYHVIITINTQESTDYGDDAYLDGSSITT